ncbi:MAG TPA: GNVR domain-containing protein [Devosiaceae bacterium]|nr:GNVR domain-containing protein [Devosiaceae bacterium]
MDAVLSTLSAALTVSRVESTPLISVTVQTGSSNLSAQLANTLVEQYIADQLQAKVASISAARDKIERRLKDVGSALAVAQNAISRNNQSASNSASPPAGVPPDAGDSRLEALRVQQNVQVIRTQYQALIARAQDLETQEYLQVPDSRLVSEAIAPAAPSAPNRRLILIMGGLAGLALGVGITVLKDVFTGGFTSVEAVEAILRTSAVAQLPKRSLPALVRGSVADSVVTAPFTAYSEAVRQLNVQADFMLRAAAERPDVPTAPYKPAEGAVVVVTSTGAGEGKTVVSLSIARSFAISGRRTLLIDADSRRGDLRRHLKLSPAHNWSDIVDWARAPREEFRTLLTQDRLTDLDTLIWYRGNSKESPEGSYVELTKILAAAKRNFDVVIVDTPPVGLVADALVLAESADLVLFVLKWGRTSRIRASYALRSLKSVLPPKVRILSTLNQRKGKNKSKYYYG